MNINRRLNSYPGASVLFILLISTAGAWVIPANAQTFNDVPTDHWAYQFIGSLSASGITAGCGNGNYCPADPVTRDQMAVFLVITFEL